MFSYIDKIVTVLINKNDKEKHIAASEKNRWQVKKIEQHASDENLLLITYIKR